MEPEVLIRTHEWGNIDSSLEYVMRENLPRSASILDVGCSYGSLIRNMVHREYGLVFGVDVSRASLRMGCGEHEEVRGRLAYYDGETLPFPDECFDVVTMFDVMEHVPTLEALMRNEIRRVMKSGGLLLFQTPNKYVNIPWEILKQKSLTRYKEYHCSLQGYVSLHRLLKRAGFSDLRVERHNILTEHNRKKVARELGPLGSTLLQLAAHMPAPLSTNFWGRCRK